jgi:CheY-like chemotaxis protein
LDGQAAREHDLAPGAYVAISVADTGTGMPPEILARAFDPFFTTKPLGMGTGLGLSMIYGFAQQSGGQAQLSSVLGEGTKALIYLPRCFGGVAEPGKQKASSDTGRAADGETVLVVDDEPLVRMLIVDVLEDLGYAAIEAVDGAAGLKVLQSDARIDLLISDVGLPGGMNGRQMADAARQFRPELKVLFITGYAESAVLGAGDLDHGMQVLTKPFAMDAISAKIRRIIADG